MVTGVQTCALPIFAMHTMYTTFTWLSASAAVLELVRDYSERNRDTLALWSKEYAEELNTYIDTLDTLLDEETYNELVKLGIVRE